MKDLINTQLKKIPLNLELLIKQTYQYSSVVGYYFEVINIENKDIVTNFSLRYMSGCHGVMIIYGVVIYPPYKGVGYAHIFEGIRELLCIDLCCSGMVCTVVNNNIIQKRVIEKRGWQIISQIKNKKTNNNVDIYFKKI